MFQPELVRITNIGSGLINCLLFCTYFLSAFISIILVVNRKSSFLKPLKEICNMKEEKSSRGLLAGRFESKIWNSRVKSANVTKAERILGYAIGPFGIMMLQSIVNSYFNQYLTDVLGFTVSKGVWIASFMVIFPVLSKVFDAITNVIEIIAELISFIASIEAVRALS